MLRTALLGLAGAAALAASAPAFADSYYNNYYAPTYSHSYSYQPQYVCKNIVVGYRTVYDYSGYHQEPIYKQVCSYGY